MTRERPLAGVRVAVKDVYRLTGVKASLNVRSFLETYGPDVEIAAYVKKLIDLGAVIVGKTKTAAFAGSEKAPEYWIDFQCPFNPRADGYQVPSGSTSGGGAGLAGYKWLDFSLGTDSKSIQKHNLNSFLIVSQPMAAFEHQPHRTACMVFAAQ